MSQEEQHPYELYRMTSIGMTLEESLDELITNGHIEPQLAMRTIQHFDKSIARILGENVKANMKFKGNLDASSNYDDVWKFVVKDGRFKMHDGQDLAVKRIKIVACKAKE